MGGGRRVTSRAAALARRSSPAWRHSVGVGLGGAYAMRSRASLIHPSLQNEPLHTKSAQDHPPRTLLAHDQPPPNTCPHCCPPLFDTSLWLLLPPPPPPLTPSFPLHHLYQSCVPIPTCLLSLDRQLLIIPAVGPLRQTARRSPSAPPAASKLAAACCGRQAGTPTRRWPLPPLPPPPGSGPPGTAER